MGMGGGGGKGRVNAKGDTVNGEGSGAGRTLSLVSCTWYPDTSQSDQSRQPTATASTSDVDHSGSSVSTSSEMLGLSPPTVNHPATQKPTWPDEMNAGQGGTLRIICLDFTVTSS